MTSVRVELEQARSQRTEECIIAKRRDKSTDKIKKKGDGG